MRNSTGRPRWTRPLSLLAHYLCMVVANQTAFGGLEYGVPWLNYAIELEIGILTRRTAVHNARADVDNPKDYVEP